MERENSRVENIFFFIVSGLIRTLQAAQGIISSIKNFFQSIYFFIALGLTLTLLAAQGIISSIKNFFQNIFRPIPAAEAVVPTQGVVAQDRDPVVEASTPAAGAESQGQGRAAEVQATQAGSAAAEPEAQPPAPLTVAEAVTEPVVPTQRVVPQDRDPVVEATSRDPAAGAESQGQGRAAEVQGSAKSRVKFGALLFTFALVTATPMLVTSFLTTDNNPTPRF